MGGDSTGLERLQELESALEDTYGWLAEVFSDDWEASSLFAQLSREERSHAKLVGHEIRLLQSDEDASVTEIIDIELDELFQQIARLQRKNPPRLDEAVATALLVESSAYECYGGAVVRSTKPAINDLIQNLTRANHEHQERLHEFAEQRKFLVWVEEESDG